MPLFTPHMNDALSCIGQYNSSTGSNIQLHIAFQNIYMKYQQTWANSNNNNNNNNRLHGSKVGGKEIQ
jgi:hypothetical protein